MMIIIAYDSQVHASELERIDCSNKHLKPTSAFTGSEPLGHCLPKGIHILHGDPARIAI
jgi:hypothetical protein